MHRIMRILHVLQYQLKRELISRRTIVIFLVIGIYVYSSMEPVSQFCKAVDIKATPLGYLFMMNDYICQTVFMIGAIFILSTAPFRGEIYRYVVYRSGKMEWEIGNILYIFIITFLYTAFIVIMSVIGLKGQVSFSADWGKIWGTLARTTASQEYQLQIDISDFLIGKYDAVHAIVTSFFLEWLCFIWLGVCIYFLNSITKKALGVIVSGAFVFLDVMIYNSWAPWAYLFSPVTLSQLISFKQENMYYGITEVYAWKFFAITIAIWIAVILLRNKRVKDYE